MSDGPSIWDAAEPCPCGRMDKPAMLWLCRCCFLEKEIRYAVSEMERGLDPAWRLARLVYDEKNAAEAVAAVKQAKLA